MAGHLSPEAEGRVGECRRDHEHEHGLTLYCYNNGCRCDECRHAMRMYNRRRRARQGADTLVPAIGTERRLQSLAWLGWSAREIAERLNMSHKYLMQVRNGDRVEVQYSLHVKVGKFFARHEMVHFAGPHAKQVASTARRRGWVPPLAWNNIDNPNDQPRRVA